MTAGLATHMTVNDHYIFMRAMALSPRMRQARQLTTVLRECDKICEILAPCVFYAVRQDDNAFWR